MPTVCTAFPNIVEVLSVVDTRQYEEGPDDRWYPIPGSGDPHPCDRCGRMHEIHAAVRLSDGSTGCVGTGCMHEADMLGGVRPATLARRAARAAELKRRLEVASARLAEWDQAEVGVAAMPVPAVEVEERSTGGFTLRCGDAWALCHGRAVDDERLACVRDGWRRNRICERLSRVAFSRATLAARVDYIRQDLDRLAH